MLFSTKNITSVGFYWLSDDIASNYSEGLAIKDTVLVLPPYLISTHEGIMSDMNGGVRM